MTFTHLFLILATLLVPLAHSQESLVRFPSTSDDLRYPYNLWLRNEAGPSRTVKLTNVMARLAPVTPDLGRVSSARIIFAPGTPASIKLRPAGEEVILPFRLETSAPRGVYALELDMLGGFIEDNPPGFDPVIDYPLAHAPDLHIPETYRTGQRFLHLGNAPADYRHRRQRLRNPAIYGRMFTLTSYQENGAWFRVDGLTQEVQLKTSSRSYFPNLAPVLNDPHLAGVRRAYVGRRVWAYGGFGLTCSPDPNNYVSSGGTLRASLRVRRILRVARSMGLGLAGSSGLGGYNAASPGDMMTGTPLVVQYEPRAAPPRACPLLTQLLADSWQLPSLVSFTPPPELPRVRNSNYVGLTRQEYAWLEGYPDATFGSLSHLLKLRTWKYISIPFPIRVTFDWQGRVSERDIPQLP